ncbi:RCC1 domain-containing protein 1 isoform X16 [Myotis daubentonii]|uniref:RCC1 domain-containing protein 1 isoform X16 n=1 Tax=Myotis daubentonii TaxID=98922 RepID=UPI002873C741|nr:RCC1 domain-containing protein 1 isoform X16 [Myotis daubentonii]
MAAVQLCGQEGGALPVLQVQPRAVREVPVPSPAQPAGGRQRAPEAMAEERPGSWFGFGFCGFGQALGSGRGRQVLSPEPLCVPDAGTDICDVSAAWSYTAFVSRAGRVLLSGSAGGAADGCRDAWASESLLVVLRDGRGAGVGAELQAWAPGSALRGEPLWAQTVAPGAGREDGAGAGTRAGPLPLLPCARAYVSPRPPLYRPLAPELRARRLELGAEHALLLDEAGQVYSWGGGRHGQLGHGTLEAELAPRLLEALQGLRMAEVAAGGWHSLCVSGHPRLLTRTVAETPEHKQVSGRLLHRQIKGRGESEKKPAHQAAGAGQDEIWSLLFCVSPTASERAEGSLVSAKPVS